MFRHYRGSGGESVAKRRKKITIDRVWAVMDCGWYVNPDTIRAQVEGSIIMALGAATIHEVTFRDGLVEQKNFYAYKMPRITDAPPIEIHIMENEADAGGVGEPGLPAAPAQANAMITETDQKTAYRRNQPDKSRNSAVWKELKDIVLAYDKAVLQNRSGKTAGRGFLVAQELITEDGKWR